MRSRYRCSMCPVKTANTQLILRFFSTNINDDTVVLTTQRFPLVVVY